ncbi:MurR/RpiR family transcriptional regulator [Mollicutes bacterium LVI A0078]|nr:MurR/RpiR family transcriptional regulator [Mollicutes bacterium LVI A0075]WOO90390.1 MurR/RpiR family transcriptional regulator [Mollicutes bacterium LVI A0078]
MYLQIYDNVKLSNGYNSLSNGQKDVHQYILNNIENMKSITVDDIATECFCSTTTVNRYCKKMGANGFSDLKHAILEYGSYSKSKQNNELTNRVITRTEGLNLSDVEVIAKQIIKSKHVYVFGTGSSYVHAQYLQRLLMRCGISCTATNEVHYLRILNEVPLCIIISNSGETFSSVQVANQLENVCDVVSLTRANSRVKKLSKYSLFHNEAVVVDDSINNELNISIYLMIISLVNSVQEQLA